MKKKLKIHVLKRRAFGLGYFLKSISKAGGNISSFTPEKLRKITAMELIEVLSQNDILCEYKGHRK